MNHAWIDWRGKNFRHPHHHRVRVIGHFTLFPSHNFIFPSLCFLSFVISHQSSPSTKSKRVAEWRERKKERGSRWWEKWPNQPGGGFNLDVMIFALDYFQTSTNTFNQIEIKFAHWNLAKNHCQTLRDTYWSCQARGLTFSSRGVSSFFAVYPSIESKEKARTVIFNHSPAAKGTLTSSNEIIRTSSSFSFSLDTINNIIWHPYFPILFLRPNHWLMIFSSWQTVNRTSF